MTPVPWGLNPDDLVAFLQEVRDAVMELQEPTQPARVFSVEAADLPPAADWLSCVVRVTDLDILAHSNGSDWIREDTGAAI